MSKYIDSEKLIAEIERRVEEYNIQSLRGAELSDLLSFITSLQQEQPESICPRCAYHNKTDDFCEYPYGGRRCSINENGVYECNGFEVVEQQEQPEVDLEEERKNLSHTMLTYAAEVFGGKMLVEDISYSYRQELADYFRDLAKTAKEE